MMHSAHIPFFNIQKTKNPDDFLVKHRVATVNQAVPKTLNYIEYLLDPDFNPFTLTRLQEALSYYSTIITEHDEVHQLALEKFTRQVCLYILKMQTLDEINRIRTNLGTYFPFYIGNTAKPAWLARYIEKATIPAVLDMIFRKASYQIRIGQLSNNRKMLEEISVQFVINQIQTISNHDLSTTHQTSTYNAVNMLTRQVSRIPGFGLISGAAINTGRQSTLKGYAEAMDHLYEVNLTPFSEEEKKAHMELLFFFYSNGNEALQNNIALKIDKIIANQRTNHDLLIALLNAVAPEPLGMGWFGLTSHHDILQKLSPESNGILVWAAFESCSDQEKEDYQQMIDSAISNERTTPVPFTFNEATSKSMELLAYVISMGRFQAEFTVEINYEGPTYRQKLLMISLMESKKLTVISNHNINEVEGVLANFPPRCQMNIICNDATLTHNVSASGQYFSKWSVHTDASPDGSNRSIGSSFSSIGSIHSQK